MFPTRQAAGAPPAARVVVVAAVVVGRGGGRRTGGGRREEGKGVVAVVGGGGGGGQAPKVSVGTVRSKIMFCHVVFCRVCRGREAGHSGDTRDNLGSGGRGVQGGGVAGGSVLRNLTTPTCRVGNKIDLDDFQ